MNSKPMFWWLLLSALWSANNTVVDPDPINFSRPVCWSPIDVPGCRRPPSHDAMGSCDTLKECQTSVEKLCKDFGGVKPKTTSITSHADGSGTCSADCDDGIHVAMTTCNP
jgi:hypothetical protein